MHKTFDVGKALGSASPRTRLSAQLIIGCAVVILGVLFTLDNLDVLSSGPILRWWPIVIVLIGASRLVGYGSRPQVAPGLVLTGVGVLLLFSNLRIISFSLWDLWPLVFVAAGAALVVRGMRRTQESTGTVDPDDTAHAFVMMGAIVRKMNSSQFKGGEATAFMGGVELDLRGAQAAGETVIIDVLAWWGRIELWVPKHWKVTSEIVPIMAGYEDKSKPDADAKVHLIVRGLVVMGGVEVGN
jgi:predicted membrane protein